MTMTRTATRPIGNGKFTTLTPGLNTRLPTTEVESAKTKVIEGFVGTFPPGSVWDAISPNLEKQGAHILEKDDKKPS